MSTLFKVGDTVYHWRLNGGSTPTKVVEGKADGMYPVRLADSCEFNSKGQFVYHEPPSLSFTPYNLVTGGFSQVRPNPAVETDALVFVKDNEADMWEVRLFSHFENNTIHCFPGQRTAATNKHGKTKNWNYYSLTNPLIK